MTYTLTEVKRLIGNYAKARSAAELTAVAFDKEQVTGGEENKRELLLCMIVDVDRAEAVLTDKQRAAVMLAKAGMIQEDIAEVLGIGRRSVGYRLDAACHKMKKFLNGPLKNLPQTT